MRSTNGELNPRVGWVQSNFKIYSNLQAAGIYPELLMQIKIY